MKKKIILIVIIIILLILDIFLFFNFIYKRYKNKHFLEKYDISLANDINNNEFKINKIMLYSSASGINKNNKFQKSNWILDIYEYTDIAIFFDKPKTLTTNNTIKELTISNIKYNVSSPKYEPSLYYLDGNNFGIDTIVENFKIENTLEYTVLNFDNKDNSIMYNTPVFFSDLSNPITLKFTNTLIKNYSIENTEKLIFDGTLLTKTPLKLENLDASISFDIEITNFLNEKYVSNINIKIPIENQNKNIFDGKVLETQNVNLKFLKQ